jgi:hypothetical protein
LDLDGVTALKVAHTYCGGSPYECHGETSFDIDFVARTVDVASCQVPEASPDSHDAGASAERPKATTVHRTRPLAEDELPRVADGLARVRYWEARTIYGSDGATDLLIITTRGVQSVFSPQPYCVPQARELVEGFYELLATVEAFQ